MSLPILTSLEARRDRVRLAAFLAEHSPAAAMRAVDTIITGISALADHPLSGHLCADGFRELMIPFGNSGYVVRYRVDPEHVVIARVYHMREHR